jgi:hypothetical protein
MPRNDSSRKLANPNKRMCFMVFPFSMLVLSSVPEMPVVVLSHYLSSTGWFKPHIIRLET